MTLLPALPADRCVFSHECPFDAFVESRPQPQASEVLPPLIEAFEAIGTIPVGRHMTGYLGSLWSDGLTVPVLGYDEISRIVTAAKI